MNAQVDHPQDKPDQLKPTVEPDPKIATVEHGGEVRNDQLQPQKNDAHANGQQSHGHGEEEVIPRDLKQPGPATIIGIGVAIVVLMIAAFLIGWIPEHHREGVAESDARERAGSKPIVSTTRPSVPAAETQLTLPCDVRANQNTSLYSRATGFLKKWNVDIHDRVKAGDVLAEIDIPDVDAQLAASEASLDQSKAAVETSKANLDLAQKTLTRYEEARKNAPGSITQEDFDTRVSTRDQAAAALKQSEANVATSQADVVRQETLVGFEKIYAPFNGVVTFRGYDNGALINSTDQSAGKELFDIQETDPLRVFASVPQAYSTQISIGQPADLLVRNYPDKRFQGKVVRSTASVDPTTRTMQFQIDFPNPDNQLYPGMYGEVQLPVKTRSSTLTIPASAMVFNAAGAQVVVIKDGRAHYQKISIGRDFGTELEVVNGVAADDQIDVNPDERITENSEVELRNSKDTASTAQAPMKVAAKD